MTLRFNNPKRHAVLARTRHCYKLGPEGDSTTRTKHSRLYVVFMRPRYTAGIARSSDDVNSAAVSTFDRTSLRVLPQGDEVRLRGSEGDVRDRSLSTFEPYVVGGFRSGVSTVRGEAQRAVPVGWAGRPSSFERRHTVALRSGAAASPSMSAPGCGGGRAWWGGVVWGQCVGVDDCLGEGVAGGVACGGA